jgi:hypothetical protein
MGQKGGRGTEKEKRTRTESVSFRIERSVLDDLREESKEKIESLNVLVNKILRFHIDFHKPILLVGHIYFPKTLISKIFDMLTDEQIEEVAEDYIKGAKEQMQMSRQKYTHLDYLDGLRKWLNASAIPYEYQKTDSGVTLKIRYEMGKKWCIFSGRFHELMFRDFGVEDSTVEIIDNTVTLTIQT